MTEYKIEEAQEDCTNLLILMEMGGFERLISQYKSWSFVRLESPERSKEWDVYLEINQLNELDLKILYLLFAFGHFSQQMGFINRMLNESGEIEKDYTPEVETLIERGFLVRGNEIIKEEKVFTISDIGEDYWIPDDVRLYFSVLSAESNDDILIHFVDGIPPSEESS